MKSSEKRESRLGYEAAYRARLALDPYRLAKRKAAQKEWRDASPDRKKAYSSKKILATKQKRPWMIPFRSARRRARKYGMDFELTVDWAIAAYKSCSALSGLPFGIGPYAPSIDRIDSSLGYSIANSRLVLQAENLFKNEWHDDVVIAIAMAIAEKNK